MPQSETRHLSVRDKAGIVLWLRLVKCYNLAMRAVRNALNGELTLPQFDVLTQLSRNEEGLNFSQLSELLLVTAGNLTGIIDRMVKQGLVAKHVNPQDRREVFLKLTTSGRELCGRLIPQHELEILKLISGMPEQAIESLKQNLGLLRDALEVHASKGDA
ncbi:MAG: MarR family transcriptional regulator [Planctomycetes bacterium]|nr:MarR family transcriptional regulator [Planctomycetota bacterium]